MNRARSELRTPAPRPAHVAALLGLVPLIGAGAALAGRSPGTPSPARPFAQDEDEGSQRAFQIYDTQVARALADDVREHLDEGRTAEALAGLQTLLEDHATDVLALPRRRPDPRRPEQERFQGAADWALETLVSLPVEARALYRERHAARAAASLRRGLEQHDPTELLALARRWPLTDAARTALVAAGDLLCERGHLELAADAWGRALARLAGRARGPSEREDWTRLLLELDDRGDLGADERTLLAGLRARAGRVLDAESGTEALDDAQGLTFLGGQDPGGRPFSDDTDPWPAALELPQNPYQSHAASDPRLFPVRSGDRLLISTSRAVLCVGAHTGAPIWSSEARSLGPGLEPWSQVRDTVLFGEAVDVREGLVAPAVGEGVVVAPLQVPLLVEAKQNYNQMEIIKVKPERRLFAFSVEDGRLLWGHAPPADWDGDGGSLPERASVSGPPVVVGSRVLVPCVIARGRLDLRVACYDLHSGDLLWSTPLISGQRALNMFGRMTGEFVSPPLTVVGSRVVCLTQLGVVSCLDLFSGAPLWQAAYPQIRMERGHYTRDSHLASVWRNAPARVVGDAVVVAPVDSAFLLAYGLQDGAPLWELSNQELGDILSPTRGGNSLSRLVGVDAQRVYLDGRRVAAFEVPVGDVAERAPTRLAWAYPADDAARLSSDRAVPVLAGRSLYVSDGPQLVELDAGTGRRRGAFTWPEARGNVLLDDGSLFALNPVRLVGHFEWESMVVRARRRVQDAPGEPEPVEELAALLVQRGVSTRTRAEDARGLEEAARYLQEARVLLEELGGRDGARLTESARKGLYRALREQATTRRTGLDPVGARESLEHALPLAPSRVEAMETLLVLQAVQRGRDEEARRTVLDELRDRYGVVDHVFFPQAGGASGRPAVEERLAGLEPVAARFDGDRTRQGVYLPVSLFARVELAQSLADSRRDADVGREFEQLYAIVAEHGDVPLVEGLPAGQWATERIAHMLDSGRTAGHDAVEDAARTALRSALDLGDEAALAEVVRCFPLTAASAEANRARLDAALSTGDADRAAAIVLGELSDDWRPERADGRQVEQLLRLAQLFLRRGNPDLAAGLAGRLAAAHGERPVSLDGQSRSVAAWADTWRLEAPPLGRPADPAFGPGAQVERTYPEGLDPIGSVLPAPGAEPVLVLRREAGLQAYGEGEGGRVLWRKLLGPTEKLDRAGLATSTALTRGRVHLATPSSVKTLRALDSENLWTWRSNEHGAYEALAETEGVLAVSQSLSGSTADAILLVGLDAASGVELWRTTFSGQRFRSRVVAGDGWIVLLPRTNGLALVLDAFTGSLRARFPVPYARRGLADGAWIEDGRILLPGFTQVSSPQYNQLRAVDLESGEDAWVLPIARGNEARELESVLQHGGRTYLLLSTIEPGGSQSRVLVELNPRNGALDATPVVRLEANERLLGVTANQRQQLPSGSVVSVRRDAEGRGSTLVGWDLRFGRAWSVRPEDRFLLHNTSDLPLPVSSGSATAIVVQGWADEGRRGQKDPYLLVVDERANRTRVLPLTAQGARSGGVPHLVPYGGGLLVCGEESTEFLR